MPNAGKRAARHLDGQRDAIELAAQIDGRTDGRFAELEVPVGRLRALLQ